MAKAYWRGEILETLRQLVADGKSLHEMADRFGKSVAAVQAAIYDNKVGRVTGRKRDFGPSYPQEVMDAIRAGFTAGDTALAIAGRLGLSKNTVIGIRSRWMKDLVRKRPRRPANPAVSFEKQAPRPSPLVPVDEDTFNGPALVASLLDLENHHCRWPAANGGFCGCRRVPGLSYCSAHAKRAYRSPETIQNATAAASTRVDGLGIISR